VRSCDLQSPLHDLIHVRLLKRTIAGIAIVFCVAGLFYVGCRHQRHATRKVNELDVTVDRLDSLAQACESYRKLVGAWPADRTSLLRVIALNDTNILIDAWGREIVFIVHTNVPGSMWLESYGADGLPNGVGMDADIVYQLP